MLPGIGAANLTELLKSVATNLAAMQIICAREDPNRLGGVTNELLLASNTAPRLDRCLGSVCRSAAEYRAGASAVHRRGRGHPSPDRMGGVLRRARERMQRHAERAAQRGADPALVAGASADQPGG